MIIHHQDKKDHTFCDNASLKSAGFVISLSDRSSVLRDIHTDVLSTQNAHLLP